MAAEPRLPDLLERIYATGEVEGEDGTWLAAVPTGVAREEALALRRLVRDEGLERTLEVGLAYGLSAVAIASVHAERRRGAHTAIDPHAHGHYRSIGPLNLRRAGLDEWVDVIEQGSEAALPRLAENGAGAYDLVLIDGRHHFDTTLVDFFYADLLLADGGYIAVDDIDFAPVERALAFILSNRAVRAGHGRLGQSGHPAQAARGRPGMDHHVAPSPPSRRPGRGRRSSGTLARCPCRRRPFRGRAPSATLSFCITTRGPAERVRAQLELLRPHVDEIVLAVNREGGLDTLDACADLADRRLTYDFDDSPSRLIAWVLHQCSADWILRLDDDEVPSAALLRALPELIHDRRPSELFIKRRWLYREAGTMIARPAPWNAEYQSRVLRNLPGAWRFDGRVHSDVRVLGDRRHVEAPIYHCALLLQSPEAREKRALTYELLRPGVSYGGLPTNGMYLPELVEGVEVEPVPEEDLELIERVLGGSSAARHAGPRWKPTPPANR